MSKGGAVAAPECNKAFIIGKRPLTSADRWQWRYAASASRAARATWEADIPYASYSSCALPD